MGDPSSLWITVGVPLLVAVLTAAGRFPWDSLGLGGAEHAQNLFNWRGELGFDFYLIGLAMLVSTSWYTFAPLLPTWLVFLLLLYSSSTLGIGHALQVSGNQEELLLVDRLVRDWVFHGLFYTSCFSCLVARFHVLR